MKIPIPRILSSIFKKRVKTEHLNSWQWRPCTHPKTLSFRADAGAAVFETVDYSDGFNILEFQEDEDPYTDFKKSREEIAITETENQENLETETEEEFEEGMIMAMESVDPYADFKKSMEEIVESHGINDWESLEELLAWYLKMNLKVNHGSIIGAFVDLIIEITSASSYNCRHHNPKIHSLYSSIVC